MGLPALGVAYLADWAVIDGEWVQNARVDVDASGTVCGRDDERLVRDLGHVALLPGFVNAHSHAFQRAIRGATHRRGDSFWGWRDAMYRAADGLTPSRVYEITRLAFGEMLRSGITCVGEFHYVHHQPGGVPYDDPNELSWQVVRAADDVGIRVVLLEVYYARAGDGRAPLPEQKRFCDASVDAYLSRVDALRQRGVELGITPHSIRAVGADDLRVIVEYANEHGLPIHAHVSEQSRENEECVAELGKTPSLAFAEAGATQRPRAFTAVHAIHINADDRRALADQNVCACPTTEADLGDGIVGASRLRAGGTNLALGSDSNAVIDLIQEARSLEMHERLAEQGRLRLNDRAGDLGSALLGIATHGGAVALGQHARLGTIGVGRPLDAVAINVDDPSLAAVAPENLLDALFCSGTAGAVRRVLVGGVEVV